MELYFKADLSIKSSPYPHYIALIFKKIKSGLDIKMYILHINICIYLKADLRFFPWQNGKYKWKANQGDISKYYISNHLKKNLVSPLPK